MSPTIHHKYKYFHSTVQRAKDRRQKFHFCRLPFDVRPCNVKLNLSIAPHDVSWAAQTWKHLLRTQNVSEQNQKHFFVSATNVTPAGKRGNICVGNNLSSLTRALM